MQAGIDIQSAVDWENAQKEGLGKRFLDKVDKKLQSLSLTPLIGSSRQNGVRYVGLETFQYIIYYKVAARKKQVIVLRILHTKRKPIY